MEKKLPLPLRIFGLLFFGAAGLVAAACLAVFVITLVEGEPEWGVLGWSLFEFCALGCVFVLTRPAWIRKSLKNNPETANLPDPADDKYFAQLETWLKNGIIDKAEYRLLKERYSKLDIEDDYH